MSDQEKSKLKSKILEHYQTLEITSERDRQKLQEVITGCSSLEVMTEKGLRLLAELLEDLTLKPKEFQAFTLKYFLKLAKRN